MKKYTLISLSLLSMFILTALPMRSNDYIDDTYYWAPRDTKKEKKFRVRVIEAEQKKAPLTSTQNIQKERVVFLDDSITRQNPDTVVRAIIRR